MMSIGKSIRMRISPYIELNPVREGARGDHDESGVAPAVFFDTTSDSIVPASPQSSHSSPLLCHRCASPLTVGEGSFYIVRIEAFADPTPPEIDTSEALDDFAEQWERLLDQMRDMSERELMDQVYRRLTLHLCASCYRQWIENPAA